MKKYTFLNKRKAMEFIEVLRKEGTHFCWCQCVNWKKYVFNNEVVRYYPHEKYKYKWVVKIY